MNLFSGFDFFFSFHSLLSIAIFALFVIMAYRIFNYSDTDKQGRKYRRPLFYPGRICPGCGLKVITRIPHCPSCERDFSKDGKDSKVQHREF